MEANVMLSIIIPIYNMENHLERCFQSLIVQKWGNSDIEIICIDDGSTDNSLLICESYARKYSFIKVYKKENGGVSSARNYGLGKSRGEYIYWIDPDDFILDDFYSKVKDVLQAGYDLVFFDFKIIHPNGTTQARCYGEYSGCVDVDRYVIDSCDGMKNLRPMCTKITRREFWADVVFPEGVSYAEDYFVWTKILTKIKRIYYIKEFLYFYKMNSASICHNVKLDDIKTAFQFVKDRYVVIRNCGYDVSHIGEAVEACMFLQEMINIYMRTGKRGREYKEFYNLLLNSLKPYICQLLTDKRFPFKSKVRLLLFVLKMDFGIIIIKQFLDFVRR